MTIRYIAHPASGPLQGVATVPGDKSIGHRALLFSAISESQVTVQGLSDGDDNRCTRHALMAMGVTIEDLPTGQVRVHGVGLDGLKAPDGVLDCGNSGTTMRLLAGLLAGQRFDAELIGDHSLSGRPMNRVIVPLEQAGAQISGATGKKAGERYPPLHVSGRSGQLQGIRFEQPVASAQVKSALILAGLYAKGTMTIVEPGASRDHTERMLAGMGAPIAVDGGCITVSPEGWNRRLCANTFTVPGDPSSAAFLVAAGLIAGVERIGVNEVCVNRRRTGFLDVLAELGARVEQEALHQSGGEAVCNLTLSRGAGDAMTATEVAGELTLRAIDEIPVLAVVAARAKGTTVFRDVGELRVKESDRVATTCEMLRHMGVGVTEEEDSFSVQGMEGAPFQGCTVEAHGDHRIAMAAAVAALAAESPIEIRGAESVATSYPGFVSTLANLGARIDVV